MKLYSIRRRSAWANGDELGRTVAVLSDVGNKEMAYQVRWIRSYVVAERDCRLGTICIHEATNEAALREQLPAPPADIGETSIAAPFTYRVKK